MSLDFYTVSHHIEKEWLAKLFFQVAAHPTDHKGQVFVIFQKFRST